MKTFIAEALFSLLTGIISAFIYSLILIQWEKKKWQRTRKEFLSKIKGERYLANYEILNILDIDPITDEDGLLDKDDVADIIRDLPITDEQYKYLDKRLRMTVDNVERLRAQALSISTFIPDDFHKIDSELKVLEDYIFTFFMSQPLRENQEMEEKLKDRLISIVAK